MRPTLIVWIRVTPGIECLVIYIKELLYNIYTKDVESTLVGTISGVVDCWISSNNSGCVLS